MAEVSISQGTDLSCQFLSLPKDVIIEICYRLTPRETIKLALSCRSLYELITTSHSLWSAYCHRVWLYSGPCPPESSWYSEFVNWCRGWGLYQDVYADIKRAWDLVHLKFEQSGVEFDNIFKPGTSEAILENTEKRLGVALPRDYRCFLRMHGGQYSDTPAGIPSSLFGTKLQFYHSLDDGSTLRPVDMLEVMHFKQVSFIRFCGEGRLQSYVLSASSGDQFKSGSVQCISKTLRSINPIEVNLHTLASSFKEWFSQFASEMQRFPLIKGVLQRFPYNPECEATTRGISVRVGTAFSNVYSRVIEQYLVIYHITISMSDSERPSLTSKLATRHWIITDYQGKQEVVYGDGVVGYTPEISPGTVFTYTSGSHVERGTSLMEGYFTFRNLSTGEIFDVKVPRFRLEIPSYCSFVCSLPEP